MRATKEFFKHCLQWEQAFCSGGPRVLLESADPPADVLAEINEAKVELGLAPRPRPSSSATGPTLPTTPVDAHARLAGLVEANQRPVSHLKDAHTDDTRPQSMSDFLKDLSTTYGPRRDLPTVNPYTMGFKTLTEQQREFEATRKPGTSGNPHATLAGVTTVDPALHARLRLAFTGGV